MSDLTARLFRSWNRRTGAPFTRRLFRCRCGRPLFFRNSQCLACGAQVGYDPEQATLLALPDDPQPPFRVRVGRGRLATERTYVRCANYQSAAACNWLVALDGAIDGTAAPLCRSCRLNRTVPDLTVPENRTWWARIEEAKRQVVSTLIALGLPVQSRVAENPERGLAFDLLRSPPSGARVLTGHADGIVTIDIEEADDATRERRRVEFQEPYRTLLGHLRHELGHYYWYRLIAMQPAWLSGFREVYGDERADYSAALQRHHASGAPADWPQAYVSAYASAHPWEDWAETWAHYFHMIDALDTAISFGIRAQAIEATFDPFQPEVLAQDSAPGRDDGTTFLGFVNAWVELATALNEMSRSMGQPDLYPFVLSGAAVRKLYFIHRVVLLSGREHSRATRLVARAAGTHVADVAH